MTGMPVSLHWNLFSSPVKFMTAVCRCVLLCVRREAAEDGAESRGDAGEEEEDEEEKENVGGEDGTELSASNTDVMAGLLETVVILWEGVKDRLKKVRIVNGDISAQYIFSPHFLQGLRCTKV